MTDQQIIEKVDEAMKLGRKKALEEVYEKIRALFNYRIRIHNKDFDGAETEKYRYDLSRDAREFNANFNMILDAIKEMIGEPEKESEDAIGVEITDAYQPAWETVLYVDTEHNFIVTKAQLFEEFKAMVGTGTIDDGITFSDYLVNCTDKNGTLVRVRKIDPDTTDYDMI